MRLLKMVGMGVVCLSLLGTAGCAGVLWQKAYPGGVERLRVETPSKWSKWDHSGTKKDDACVLLKRESTF